MENCDYDLFARMDFISRLQAVVSAAEGILKERAALGSDRVPLAEAFFTTAELHSILISSSTVFLGDSSLPSAHVLLGQIVDTCLSEGVFAPFCVPHEVGALRTQSRGGGGIFFFEDALYLHSVILRLAFGMGTLSAPRRCAVVSPMPFVAIPLGGTVAVAPPGVAKALGRSDSLPPSSGPTDEGSLGNTDSSHGSIGGSYSRTVSNSPSPTQNLKQADRPGMSRRSLRSLPQNTAHGESVSLRDTSCSPSPEPVARGEVAEDSARAVGGDGVYMYASEANHMRRGRAPRGSQPHRALACSQFMLTGRCSFGSRCRYFHDASSGSPSGVAFGTAVPQPLVQHLVAEAPPFTGLLKPCGDARSREAPYDECEGATRSDSTGDATYIAGVPRAMFPVASLG